MQSVRQRFRPKWSGSIIRPQSLVLLCCLIFGSILRLLCILGSYLGYSVSRIATGMWQTSPVPHNHPCCLQLSLMAVPIQCLFKMETLTSHVLYHTNRLKDKNLFIFHNFSQCCEWVKTQCC